MSTDFQQQGPLASFPRGIATQFFAPWLSQLGVQIPTQFFGDSND
jgi:hypothetical protein